MTEKLTKAHRLIDRENILREGGQEPQSQSVERTIAFLTDDELLPDGRVPSICCIPRIVISTITSSSNDSWLRSFPWFSFDSRIKLLRYIRNLPGMTIHASGIRAGFGAQHHL